MNRKALLFIKEDDIALLGRIAAEMLAMPQLWCPHRACRRDRCCDRTMLDTGEPACVTYLPPGMRARYDEFLDMVVYIADNIHHPRPAGDPDTGDLEEAAIEVIRAARDSRPRLAPKFDAWLALRRKPEEIERDPQWGGAHKPKTCGGPKTGENAERDAGSEGHVENGRYVAPDHAASDDWRNYG